MSENSKITVDGIENFPKWTKQKISFDISLLTIINLLFFIVFTQFDISEQLIESINNFEHIELDEIIPLFITIALSLLFYTVRRFVELKKLFAEIEKTSVRDHLTGLYNRRCMQDKFSAVVSDCQNENHTYSVIIIDIDDFKRINDTFGHNVGDGVLAEFSDIIVSTTRDIDIVSRWGGEEFLILCPQTSLTAVSSVAKRVISAIRLYEFNGVGHITASLGAVVGNKNEPFEAVVNRADQCLYQAKGKGKDCYVAE